MRKIIIILLVLSISSFSFVYAQENYINNKGNNEEGLSNYIETNSRLEKSTGQNGETSVDKVENKVVDTTAEHNGEEQGEEYIATKGQEVEKEKKNLNSTNPGSTSKSQLSQKGVQASKQSDNKGTLENKEKNSSTVQNNTTKENSEKKDNGLEDGKEETKSIDGSPRIDISNANNGSFKAKYLSNKKLKVMVIKGGDKYTYDLKGDNSYQSYPLQLGDGAYKISIMENIGGNEYKYVLTVDAEVKTSNPNAKYLTSVQMINWNNSMAAIKKAKSLTGGLGDQQKLEKIYNYVVKNIKYDSSITKLPSGYIPNINTTFSSGKGICYDFASVFAGMLRSVGIPTKLIKGESTNISGYHAWNEVYINGKWRIIDTSYDSQLRSAGHSTTLYKSGKDYFKSKEY